MSRQLVWAGAVSRQPVRAPVPEIVVDAVLFDLDGVLIDADAIYERHWRLWASEHGLDGDAVVAVHHGRRAMEVVAQFAPHLDAAVEADRYNARLAADGDMEGMTVIADARAILTRLPPDRWAIATSSPHSVAASRLAHLGLPVPAVLVGADDVVRGKPAPDPYLDAAAGLGRAPSRCLVVEDAPAGIAAARAAGCLVAAVTTTHDAGALGQADVVVPGLADLRLGADGRGLTVQWPVPRPGDPGV